VPFTVACLFQLLFEYPGGNHRHLGGQQHAGALSCASSSFPVLII